MAVHLSRWSVGVAGTTFTAPAVGMAPARAVAGSNDGAYRFTAHLTDGPAHVCTGTLVTAPWLRTARECVESPAGPLTAVRGPADLGSSPDVDATTSGAPTTCKGDAGGPAIRESGGSVELVGVHGASWQGAPDRRWPAFRGSETRIRQ